MSSYTKNDLLMGLEDAIEALSAPDGKHAVDVLLANRTALIILNRMADNLARGAADRERQNLRKARLRLQVSERDVPLFPAS